MQNILRDNSLKIKSSKPDILHAAVHGITSKADEAARTYLQLKLRQWGASNVYLLVLSS